MTFGTVYYDKQERQSGWGPYFQCPRLMRSVEGHKELSIVLFGRAFWVTWS